MSISAVPAASPALTRCWKVLSAGLVASALLAGSFAPSAAFSNRTTAHTAHTLGYAAAPPHAGAYRADLMPDDRMVDDATSYCVNRFKSYDPETGTYLGYDGVEHPCP